RHLFDGVAFDVVTDLKLAEAFDPDTAFHAGADFVYLILEPTQRLGEPFVNDLFASADADLSFDNATARDHTPGDGRALRQLENLAHLSRADGYVFEDRFEQSGHAFLHLIDELINNRVEFDLYAFVFCFVGHATVDAGMETKNDRVRS